MKFSITDVVSKWDQIRRKLLLKKFIMENFIFVQWKNMVYKHFSKSLQGSKWAITMRPVSTESTLPLFLFYRTSLFQYIIFVLFDNLTKIKENAN